MKNTVGSNDGQGDSDKYFGGVAEALMRSMFFVSIVWQKCFWGIKVAPATLMRGVHFA